jgi:hypothetical protein
MVRRVVLPKAALTGSHITRCHGRDRVRMRNRFPRFFLTIIVVHNVSWPIWLPDVTRARRGFAWKGARMLNRKLRNIALGGPFHWKWRHETSPIGLLPGKYAGAHEWPEVPLGCYLGRPRPLYHCLALSLVICPLPAILLAPSIITFLTFVVFG